MMCPKDGVGEVKWRTYKKGFVSSAALSTIIGSSCNDAEKIFRCLLVGSHNEKQSLEKKFERSNQKLFLWYLMLSWPALLTALPPAALNFTIVAVP